MLVFFGSEFSLIHTPNDSIDAVDADLLGGVAAIVISGLTGDFGGITAAPSVVGR